jgi:hypothetical protein
MRLDVSNANLLDNYSNVEAGTLDPRKAPVAAADPNLDPIQDLDPTKDPAVRDLLIDDGVPSGTDVEDGVGDSTDDGSAQKAGEKPNYLLWAAGALAIGAAAYMIWKKK